LTRGFFVQPTVLTEVTGDMRVAQEEIFGPVLTILPYRDDDEAVALANGTDFGLSGAVWADDPRRAEAVARRLRTGQVSVNGGRFNPAAPFGGYKKSGIGRELGVFGLEEYLETKALHR
jgi:acyl-CoA reductase-like NAD-dependent aldehyde dehydrogenase